MNSLPSPTIFPQGHFLGRTDTRWSAGGFALARMVPTVPEHEVHEHTHAEAHFVVLLRGEYLSSAEGAPALAREPPGCMRCTAVVAKATDTWLPEFFRSTVGDPLQMRDYHINLMPGGDPYLAGGLYLRPRDMLKLGQLYLDGGRWHGQRVVDADWVEASTRQHSAFTPGHGYGYGWHLHTMTVAGHAYREYAAEGNGGQFVIVVPELELVVGIQAGNYGDFATWYKLQDLVPQFVIPALQGSH